MRNMTKDVVLLLVSDKASPSITTNTSGEQKMFSCFQTAIFEPGMSFFLRWAFPNHFFFIFVFSIVQLVDKILPLSGFELLISGVGSNRSTN